MSNPATQKRRRLRWPRKRRNFGMDTYTMPPQYERKRLQFPLHVHHAWPAEGGSRLRWRGFFQ
jgi:hypothetical protein